MIKINKVVKRKCSKPVFDGGYRDLIIAIEPGDIVAVKPVRAKKWFRITAQDLYSRLVWSYAMQEAKAFQKKVKELVKGGLTKREARKIAKDATR